MGIDRVETPQEKRENFSIVFLKLNGDMLTLGALCTTRTLRVAKMTMSLSEIWIAEAEVKKMRLANSEKI